MSKLWLVGMMGSGKSRVGRLVAAELGIPFLDTDAEIARLSGCSIPEIFSTVGEERFRDLEEAVVAAVAAGEDSVVATGGGAVLRRSSVEQMRQTGHVVWLRASAETLALRVHEGRGRPLLAGEGPMERRLHAILEERADLYAAAADSVIDTDWMESDEVANLVVAEWKRS